ncbi:MAG: sigma-70 family RNA polymerase sigma factor [Myxococcota bacterium]
MDPLVENRELLAGFRRGDATALRAVYEAYVYDLSAFLRRGFVFNAGEKSLRFRGYDSTYDLEDCLQEVFRRAFGERARDSYDGLRPYRNYLWTIARNVVINDYQARMKTLSRYDDVSEHEPVADEEWTGGDDPLGTDPSAHPNPEKATLSEELRGLVDRFVDDLPAREHQVFELRYRRGLNHLEIEAHTQLSPSKIKTTEARIRKRLLRFLHQHGYFQHTTSRERLGGVSPRSPLKGGSS